MPHFSYEALDAKGASKSGRVMAGTEKEAIERIKAQALYPVKVYQVLGDPAEEPPKPVRRHVFRRVFFGWGIPARHFVPFLNDLASLIGAGIPLVRSLTLLERQADYEPLRNIIHEVRQDVEGGSSLTEAVKHYPRVFSPLFVNMVRSGELGGILDQVLNRLALFAERTEYLKARVRSAVAYPLVVLAFALLVILFLVSYVVPKMFVIFEDVGTRLPAMTLFLFRASMFLRTRWYVPVGLAALLFAAGSAAYRVEAARLFVDRWKLKLPVFGPLAQKVALARFARTFATLTQSGVPILATLGVVEESTGNLIFQHALRQVRAGIREGEGIAGPLSSFQIFPPVVTNMIQVGEETGSLAEILAKIADKYDEDVQLTLNTLTSLLEPFLIILLGLVVGFIVVALFLPMVPLVQSLSNM